MKKGLREIRLERGISQEDLAELVNVSRQTVSKWENGTVSPSADNLSQLSRALGVPVDALLVGDWTPPEPQVVEVPVEVPVPRPRNERLWALVWALVLAAGVMIGALLFWERGEEPITEPEMQSEVIDPAAIGEGVSLIPME